GYDISIDFNGRTGNKPIHWEYFEDPQRRAVYDAWAQLNLLAVGEPIFESSVFSLDVDNPNVLKTIYLTDPTAAVDEISQVVLLCNLRVVEHDLAPNYPHSGLCYELLLYNLNLVLLDVNDSRTLAPGEYRIFRNRPSGLIPHATLPDEDSDGVLDSIDL